MTQKREPMKLDDDIEWEVIPSYGRLLVKLYEREKITASGIIIPDTASKDRATTGLVVAIPDQPIEGQKIIEEEDLEPYYKVGDVLIFGRYTGTEIVVGTSTFIILREGDVLGKLQVQGGGKVPVERLLGEEGPVKMVDRD